MHHKKAQAIHTVTTFSINSRQHSMAKSNAATTKSKGKAHTKAPPKKPGPKRVVPKKAPAMQLNKHSGVGKRAAEDKSSSESSSEVSDHRPHKKCMSTSVESSDDEGLEASHCPENEPEVLHAEQGDGHEFESDFKVLIL